jgi:hypothetical protein
MDASPSQRCCTVTEVVGSESGPLGSARHQMCQSGSVCHPLEVKGACHEAYDYWIGFGKASVSSAYG